MALEVNDGNIEEVLSNKTVTVLDFWAPWCGPCRTLGPIIDELSSDNEGKDVNVGKINVEDHQALALKYGVRAIPTVVILKDGAEVGRSVGIKSKDSFQSEIDALLN